MNNTHKDFFRHVALIGAAALMSFSAASEAGSKPTTTTTTPNTYAGRATVLNASVTALSALGLPITVPLTVSDTGELDPTGGMRDANFLNVGTPAPLAVDLSVASAVTVGSGHTTDSTASVTGLNVDISSGLVQIGADVLQSNAIATCASGTASYTAKSTVLGLVINGKTYLANGSPNQTITLPNLATIIINEQDTVNGRKFVNALHVIVNGALAGLVKADVVVSHADVGITCGTTTTPNCPVQDFVTGGGYVMMNGAKANFGFVGGLKPNGLQGHLQFNDKSATGPRISGKTVTSYSGTGLARQVVYGCTVNGTASTCTMNVTDNGEPGTSDLFGLSTSGGYATGSQVISGGNIQLHKPSCPTAATSTKGNGR